MIVAFARTTDALLAGRKTVTRRRWKPENYARVLSKLRAAQAAGERGIWLDAWSAGPHRGGKPVGKILLTSLTWEPTRDMPDTDWEAEGFAYMAEHGILVDRDLTCAELWEYWREDPDLETAVLRFDPMEVIST